MHVGVAARSFRIICYNPARKKRELDFIFAVLCSAPLLWPQTAKSPGADADLLYQKGETAFRQGLYSEAIRFVEQARAIDPANPRYAFLLATSRFAHGDSEGTIRLLDEVARERPEDPYAQFSLGYYLHKVGRYGEAVKCFQRALTLAPELIEAKFYLARITESEGDAARARTAYREIIAARPEHAQSHAALGRLELAEGRVEEAEAHLRKCLALDPENREAHYTLGLLYRRNGRADDSRRELEIAEQLRIRQTTRVNPLPIGSPDGKSRPTIEGGTPAAESLRAAIPAQKKGLLTEAEQKYLELLKDAPELAEAHMNLGLLYHDQARYDEAIRELRKAVELNPTLAGAHYFLGIDLYFKSEFEPAVAALKRTEQIARDTPGLARWLGLSLLAAGNSQEAAEYLERHLAGSPRDSEILPVLLETYGRLSREEARERVTALERLIEVYSKLGAASEVSQLKTALEELRKRSR